MRIVYTSNDPPQAHRLSTFLTIDGIENKLEASVSTDWGAPSYGDTTCNIWIIDEDHVAAAMHWIDLFKEDPDNSAFKKVPHGIMHFTKPPLDPLLKDSATQVVANNTHPDKLPMGKITSYTILLCILIFIIDLFTTPVVTKVPVGIPSLPFMASPIKKELLYDYPKAYQLTDKLVKLYGRNNVENPVDLPGEGIYLMEQIHKTPYWRGIYEFLLERVQNENATFKPAPMFEKIREGEIWRLFSPCLLHNDILHILFNMLWLVLLGKQIEPRLGSWRYILLILAIGIFSNTCQYLVSGANFLGISGVLCGFLTFIWMRQKLAAWEGYPLDRSTFLFMMIFISTMLFLEVFSFYLETSHQMSLSPGVANTAHLSGAAIGAILGRLSFFSWKI